MPSRVDWHGDARPIFLPTRKLALLGYELADGDLGPKSITEPAA